MSDLNWDAVIKSIETSASEPIGSSAFSTPSQVHEQQVMRARLLRDIAKALRAGKGDQNVLT